MLYILINTIVYKEKMILILNSVQNKLQAIIAYNLNLTLAQDRVSFPVQLRSIGILAYFFL